MEWPRLSLASGFALWPRLSLASGFALWPRLSLASGFAFLVRSIIKYHKKLPLASFQHKTTDRSRVDPFLNPIHFSCSLLPDLASATTAVDDMARWTILLIGTGSTDRRDKIALIGVKGIFPANARDAGKILKSRPTQ
jgi:hypothetical protein